MKKPGISFCLIAKNEEKNIRKCLEHAKPLVDEMVVCDTGSTDRTIEIAKELGARVVHFEWINDFAAARNFCADQAEYDYMMLLDADEWVSTQDIENAKKDFAQARSLGKALVVINQTYMPATSLGTIPNPGTHPNDEMGIGYLPVFRVILCPSKIRHIFRVHENADIRECGFIQATFPAHHSGHMDVEKTKSKDWYYQLGLQKLKEHGDCFEIRTELGTQAYQNGLFKEALDHYRRAAMYMTTHPEPMLGMASCFVGLKMYKKAYKELKRCYKMYPAMSEAGYNLAWCSMFVGKVQQCEDLCVQVLRKRPGYTAAVVLGVVSLMVRDGSPEGVRALITRLKSTGVQKTLTGIGEALVEAGQQKFGENILKAVSRYEQQELDKVEELNQAQTQCQSEKINLLQNKACSFQSI